MPEPVSKYATDHAVYAVTRRIAPHLCNVISPNAISVIGFLFVVPIIYNYAANRGYTELVVLGMLRQFGDCLDGTVARSCGKMSTFGAKLDIALDVLTCVLISLFVLYRLAVHPPRNRYKIAALVGLIATALYNIIKYALDKTTSNDMEHVQMTPFFQAWHDNSFLGVIVTVCALKYLITD